VAFVVFVGRWQLAPAGEVFAAQLGAGGVDELRCGVVLIISTGFR
jgi:hypothetical protein